MPLIARNLLDQIRLLSAAARLFAEKLVDGIEVNYEMVQGVRGGEPDHGHRPEPLHRLRQGAARSSRRRPPPGRPLREVARENGVEEETLDEALDLAKMAKGNLG